MAGYVTRGRADELEQQIAALRAEFDAREAGLRREIAEARALALSFARASATALVQVLSTERSPTNHDDPREASSPH